MSLLAPRITRIRPSASTVAAARERALIAAGRDIVDFSIGEPDFPTPENVKQAAARAMANDETHYTATGGTPAVVSAVREKFLRDNELEYASDEVMVSSGAKHAMFNAFMCTVSEGDEVIIPAPFWISYPNQVKLAGGNPIIVECNRRNRFKLSPDALKDAITGKTKWVVLNSPNNPTGAVYTEAELRAIADVLTTCPSIQIMSDEIYEHFLYDDAKHVSILQVAPELKGRTIIVNGVSKAYAMTGWRIGCVGGPSSLIKAMAKFQSQSTSCPSSISQAAAAEAFSGSQSAVVEMKKVMQYRRNLILGILSQAQELSITPPAGAMYLFCNCESFYGSMATDDLVIRSDADFVEYLLNSAGVNTVPGSAYGAPGHFRLSFATSEAQLVKGGQRITMACDRLKG